MNFSVVLQYIRVYCWENRLVPVMWGGFVMKSNGMPTEILTKLNVIAGFPSTQEIELYEIEDGDITCFQKSHSVETEKQYRYPDVPSFFQYMHNFQVQNSYRIKKNGAPGQKVPTTPEPKDNQHVKQLQTPPARTLDDEIKEEATKHTAQLIAEVENKSFLALEADEEAEQFEKRVEEAEAVRLFAMEILERTTRGEVVSIN